jgi:hypothetical protein
MLAGRLDKARGGTADLYVASFPVPSDSVFTPQFVSANRSHLAKPENFARHPVAYRPLGHNIPRA